MGGRTWTADARVLRTYSKSFLNPWNEPRTLYSTLNVGDFASHVAAGGEQLGGISSASRSRLVKPRLGQRGPKVLLPLPYSVTIERFRTAPYEIRGPGDTMNFNTAVSAPHDWDTGHIAPDPDEELKAIAKLRKGAYGSGWNAAIMAVEAPKAIEMIGSSALRVRRGLLCAALGDWRGIIKNLATPTAAHASTGRTPKIGGSRGKRAAQQRWEDSVKQSTIGFNEGRKTLSSLWLEIQYGWKPLLKDIEDGAMYLSEALTGNQQRTRPIVGARTYERKSSVTYPGTYAYYRDRTTVTTIKYTVTGARNIQSPFIPNIYTVAGAAWERLPYSFVCDWVVPVGLLLDALRTAADIEGTIVRSLHQETTWSGLTTDPIYGRALIPLDPGITPFHRRVSFSRTVSTEISPPLPVGSLSPDSIFASGIRAANAVALLQNLRFRPGDRSGIKKLLDGTP